LDQRNLDCSDSHGGVRDTESEMPAQAMAVRPTRLPSSVGYRDLRLALLAGLVCGLLSLALAPLYTASLTITIAAQCCEVPSAAGARPDSCCTGPLRLGPGGLPVRKRDPSLRASIDGSCQCSLAVRMRRALALAPSRNQGDTRPSRANRRVPCAYLAQPYSITLEPPRFHHPFFRLSV
jgi:hypothetical protein